MTEVMLMSDVKKLGKAGAVVKVAPGYARNYLIPRGIAAPVTEASRRRLAKLEEKRAEERKARRAEAEKLAAKLAGVEVKVNAPTVDGKRLYGSVRARDILEVIKTQRQVEFERSQINLPDELKEIGSYDAKIELPEGVTVPFKVLIGEQTETPAE